MAEWLEQLEDGRCAKWRLHWTRGSRGSRTHRSRRFDGGKREAKAALREFASECDAAPVETATLAGFARAWNERRLASGAIADSTYWKYEWHLRGLEPHFPMPLDQIRASDVSAACAALMASRAPSTVASMHASLVRMLQAAVDEGLLASVPKSDPPKASKSRRRALPASGVSALLDALDPSDARQFAVALIACTGLRRGEACALRWRDVEGDVIRVPREATKSDAGERSVPMDVSTSEMVETRRRHVEAALSKVGSALSPSDALCCTDDGRPLTPNALRLWWQRHRAGYCLDGVTLHELRHTYLTNLAQAGVHPSVMQRLAGHASMRTTLSVYTHVHDEDLRAAADALGNLRDVHRDVHRDGSVKRNQASRLSC